MTTYGHLFKPENSKEFCATLHEKVVADVLEKGINISEIVEQNIDRHIEEMKDGFPDTLLIEAMDEKHGAKFCKDCEKPRCCTQSDPIEVNYWDLKKLSKHMGMTNKQFAKKYLKKHVSKYAVSGASYAFVKTLPCEFLHDEKCQIYEARPTSCRIFPIIQERKKKEEPIFDVQVNEWCNYAFNIIRNSLVNKAIFEQMTIDRPDLATKLLSDSKRFLPTEKDLEGLSQYGRLLAIKEAQEKWVKVTKK